MGRGPSIEGRKNAADAQRAKIFTKLAREINLAARVGGTDPGSNARLRLAVDKALNVNMTKDAIDRAIKRGGGALDADSMQEIRYEGYAPAGVAVMVDCMTDNPTRTVADVRHAFARHGGHLGISGSVSFQFSEVGQLTFDIQGESTFEEQIIEVALDANADDVETVEGLTTVLTRPDLLQQVRAALEQAGLSPLESDIVMRPESPVTVAQEAADSVRKLFERLNDLDDVHAVYHNAHFSGQE